MSRLTDWSDILLQISNVKSVDLTIFLLSWTELSICSNAFNWSISSMDKIEVLKWMSNPLNLILLYYELVNELKLYGAGVT